MIFGPFFMGASISFTETLFVQSENTNLPADELFKCLKLHRSVLQDYSTDRK